MKPAPPRRPVARLIRGLLFAGSACLVLVVVAGVFYIVLVDHRPPPDDPRSARDLPEEIASRYRYAPDVSAGFSLEESSDPQGHPVVRGRFDYRRLEGGSRREARFEFYRVAGERARPAVLISPITAGGYDLERLIARDLVAHGMHAVIIRRPPKRKLRERLTDVASLEQEIRDGQAARLRLLDWMKRRPEMDDERIGAYGVSLGGMMTVLLTALDEDIDAAVAVMAGGDLPDLLSRTTESGPNELARADGLPEEPDAAERAAFAERVRPLLESDPLLLAPFVDPEEMFLVMTRRDTAVPSDLQKRLREALGRPEALSFPTGHYSVMIYLPLLKARARDFLAERLEAAD